MDVFDKHQTRIAVDTLKMTEAGALIMGGMDHAQAREHLARMGWSQKRIDATYYGARGCTIPKETT